MIMLEEIGFEYDLKLVNIGQGEQNTPEYLAIAPSHKIPALVDEDAPGAPLKIFESGAILLHLAEKSGQFLPAAPDARMQTLSWVFWQTGSLGPMFGQYGHFTVYAKENVPYGVTRYTREALDALIVLNGALTRGPYVAGADYTIADMMIYPWVAAADPLFAETETDVTPVRDWLSRVGERPAVQRALSKLKSAAGAALN